MAVTLTITSIAIGTALAIFTITRGPVAARQFLLSGHKFAVWHGYMLLGIVTAIVGVISLILLERHPQSSLPGAIPITPPPPSAVSPYLSDLRLVRPEWIPPVVEAYKDSILTQDERRVTPILGGGTDSITWEEMPLIYAWLQEECAGMGLASNTVSFRKKPRALVAVLKVNFSERNRFTYPIALLRQEIYNITGLPWVVVDMCIDLATTPLSRALAQADDELQISIDSEVAELLAIIEPQKSLIRPTVERVGSFVFTKFMGPDYFAELREAAVMQAQELLQKEYQEYSCTLDIDQFAVDSELKLMVYKKKKS